VLIRYRIERGELEEARSALKALQDIGRLVGTAPLRAAADLAEGLLAAAGGEHDRARALLEDAVDRFERSGGRFDAAQARLELATSLLVLGRTDMARIEAGVALDCMRELGAVVEAQRAQRIFAASVGSGSGHSPLTDITPREREVLGLLAKGLTNRQIADRLVVSEHTVHRHVTNILRKLALPSRTAAAAHAVRCGLLDAPDE